MQLAKTLLGLAGMVSAAPLSDRVPYTSTLWAKAFVLVANVTDLSRDLNPSIHLQMLTGVHDSAGSQVGTLTSGPGRIFYENGTDDAIGVISDSNGNYPSSMILQRTNNDPHGGDYLETVGLTFGDAENGIGIRPADQTPWPELYTPDDGIFVACDEAGPEPGHPLHPVLFARFTDSQQIPISCAPITLLAQCATLRKVPSGAPYNHDYVRSIRCYGNASVVDWN